MEFLDSPEEWFSRCHSQNSNIDIIWELLRNINSQTPALDLLGITDSGGGLRDV